VNVIPMTQFSCIYGSRIKTTPNAGCEGGPASESYDRPNN
jgi:hypothetical protein